MRGVQAFAAVLLLCSGCLSIDHTRCGDLYCADDKVCAPDHTQCVFPEQLDACNGVADSVFCTYAAVPTGVCQAGVCISQTSETLSAPASFAATDGTASDYVDLTWSAVDGASGYRVWRDAVAIMDVDAPSYRDTSAASGGVPAIPGTFTAGQATDTNGVQLAWAASSVATGTVHTYFVTALASGLQSAPSPNDTGFRGAYPVTGYEVSLDGGTSFTDEGIVTAYFDALAPVGGWTGTVTASDGGSGQVTLALTTLTKVPITRSYQVRAVSAAGHSAAASATGSRDVGNPTGYQWQLSDTSTGTYTNIAGATVAAYDYTSGPVIDVQYFHCTVTGANGALAIIGPDSGWRAIDAPTNVAASDGTSTSKVDLSWNSVYDATTYRVYRDGGLVTEVSATSYADTGATPGGAPGAPASLAGTQGTLTSGVKLTWSAPTTPAGTTHVYTVTALKGTTEGTASSPDDGFRAAYPVTSYEVSIDGGSNYVNVNLAVTYTDSTAPYGTWDSTASATGAPGKVALSLSTITPVSVPRTYHLRAISAGGTGTDANANGYRSIGAPTTYQWQWSSDGTSYTNLAGATTTPFDDTTGPAYTPRYYQCLLSDGNGATATIGPAIGTRTLEKPSTIAATDGTSITHVTITWSAVNLATAYRVYRNGTPIFDTADASFLTYDDTGAGAATGIPGAPQNFQASNTFSDKVHLSWTAVAPTNGPTYNYTVAALSGGNVGPVSDPDPGYRGPTPITYDLKIGSGSFTSIGISTSYDDTTAPNGSYTATVNATDGAPAKVTLTVTTVPVDGSLVSYAVRAVNPNGPGTASTAGGFRTPPAATFQWQRSAAQSNAAFSNIVGATTATYSEDAAVSPYPSFQLRWFRCVVSGTGMSPVTTPADSGWRGLRRLPTNASWVATGDNASVNTSVVAGSLLYIGGTFTFVGPHTGAFTKVGATGSGAPDTSRPVVSTSVHAVVPDGSGGWYVAGAVTRVGFSSAAPIIHISSTGVVDSAFNPPANDGSINALALNGSVLYAGGTFTNVGGVSRLYLAAFNTANGALLSWAPTPSTWVNALAVYQGKLYVGGNFTSISGVPRSRLAAVDLASGAVDAFNIGADQPVRQLIADNGILYVRGDFLHVGGLSRPYLASIDTFGAVTTWNPNANNSVGAMYSYGLSSIYVAGLFTTIGATPATRVGLAEIDASGNATAWDPGLTTPFTTANALVVVGSNLYVGGSFTQVDPSSGTLMRKNLFAISTALGGANITAWNPGAGSAVYSLSTDGTSLFVGGDQASVGVVARNRLAAIDLSTGVPTSWDPNVTGQANASVDSIAVTAASVLVGGTFTAVGGTSRSGAAAVDSSSGAALAWNPGPVGSVYAVATDGNNIYVGGAFSTIGGQTRNNIASFSASTGNLNTWNPGADAAVRALAFNGSDVLVGGDFTTIASSSFNHIAAFDTSTGMIDVFVNPDANGTVRAIVPGGSGVFIAGAFDQVSGAPHGHIAMLDPSNAMMATPWNGVAPGSDVGAIAQIGSVVYSCGNGGLGVSDIYNDGASSDWSVSAPTSVPCTLSTDSSSFIARLYVGGLMAEGLQTFDP